MSGSEPRLGDFFASRRELGDEHLPVLSVTLRDGLIPRDTIERRFESELEGHEHLAVRKGDIAYNTMRMWQGASGLASYDAVVSPAYVVLRPKDGIDPLFASYWFKSARMIHLFWAYSYGLTEDRLRLYYKDFAAIPASPPPLDWQRDAATVLLECDRAIGICEALVATKRFRLERLRANIFNECDCDHESLGNLAELATGSPAPQRTGDFDDNGIPFVRVSNLDSLSDSLADCDHITSDAARGFRLFPEGTIVFAKSGMSAKLERVARLPKPAHIVGHLAAVLPHGHVSLIYHWLCHYHPARLVQGDGFPSLRLSDLAAFPVRLPKARDAAENLLDLAQQDLTLQVRQAAVLRLQKRGLMQKLLDSEFGVRAAVELEPAE